MIRSDRRIAQDREEDSDAKPPSRTHNGGPPLDNPDEHTPPWGKNGIGNYFAWRRAYRKAWKPASREITLHRLQKARECGVTYEEYMAVLLDTGRHLQPGDTALIWEIIASRRNRRTM